jgi:hypothetical protein
VNLFGLFVKRGKVLSSRESAQYFADLNHLSGAPGTNETNVADGVRVEHVLWRNDSKVEVELVAIHGGGHGMPQPYRRRPRLLGPSPKEPNGPEVIWAFFERQLRHPLGARTVEPATGPAAIVQRPEHAKARRTAEVIGAERVLPATTAPSSIQGEPPNIQLEATRPPYPSGVVGLHYTRQRGTI